MVNSFLKAENCYGISHPRLLMSRKAGDWEGTTFQCAGDLCENITPNNPNQKVWIRHDVTFKNAQAITVDEIIIDKGATLKLGASNQSLTVKRLVIDGVFSCYVNANNRINIGELSGKGTLNLSAVGGTRTFNIYDDVTLNSIYAEGYSSNHINFYGRRFNPSLMSEGDVNIYCYGSSVVIPGHFHFKIFRSYGNGIQLESGITIDTFHPVNNTLLMGDATIGYFQGNSTYKIFTNQYGTITFTGKCYLGNTFNVSIDFSVGNPDVTIGDDMTCLNFAYTSLKTGSGIWRFTKNNSTVGAGLDVSMTTNIQLDADLRIAASTNINFYINPLNIVSGKRIKITNKINGEAASAKMTLTGITQLIYEGADCPMSTGDLDASSTDTLFNYARAGNQDVKGGTYGNLTFSGSGTKKLLGNVTVTGTYSLEGSASVDLNGYTLTY